MKLDTLHQLWVHELKDLHSAESQLLEALPKMISAARDSELKAALSEHLEQTRGQLRRLDKIFKGLDFSAGGQRCKGMEGLLEEASHAVRDASDDMVRDAAIIAAAQRVEHYEIAGYGTAGEFAHQLGEHDAAALLQETLDEESAADTRLTRLARRRINFQAMVAAK
jgi:ferritin-like metal-binding protein YciE